MDHSPRPHAHAHGLLRDCVSAAADSSPLSLHEIFFGAYIANWRPYIAFYERKFLRKANSISATYIEQPLSVKYEDLSFIYSLENRFPAATSMLTAAQQALAGAAAMLRLQHPAESLDAVQNVFENHGLRCAAYARAADHLRQRSQTTAQLLATTLSQRDQVIAKEQNRNMLLLNKSAVFVTALTLVYAPASFIATFFGMNFFAMDQGNSRIVATPMIWIYLVATLGLTMATVAFYYLLVRYDEILFRLLAPRVPKLAIGHGLRNLTQRFTNTRQAADIQLQGIMV
ncbi:hypothetical protein XA68_15197 [Ophiocordyceps unilateralis]|uniref:Uncharacterized protein n=1 Tax=Ophiocordyceps unilateralis TaxID=268505 RepID=A0A2A9P8L2_OPHUN|nr:hypothetical protein XA68_15197 [Ophiocordyceps unilateralis]